jgi:CRISPR-associated exonuclease Cas4
MGKTDVLIKRQFMHTEDDLLPISALQHMLFCERQTALIHLERLWIENRFTAEGRLLHKKTDNAKSETRDGVRITRSLPVHSFQLGIYGVCDVVNFTPPAMHSPPGKSLAKRVQDELQRLRGESDVPHIECTAAVRSEFNRPPFHLWQITPVEYKRGQPKENAADRVQLCAQAMCLEEMLGVKIPHGELFYGKRQRQTEVVLSDELRQLTADTAIRLHQMIANRKTPKAIRELKCASCSLLPVCMPPESRASSTAKYLNDMLRE